MAQPSSEVMTEKSFRTFWGFKGEWKVIGAGGGGQIFKARHRQLKRDVAIKIIGPDNG